MRLWVDDERRLEEWRYKPSFEHLLQSGWKQAFTYTDAVIKISSALYYGDTLDAISLDNDLGDKLGREGYDLLTLIEELIFIHSLPVPEIFIHTANTPAGDKMRLVVARIQERHG